MSFPSRARRGYIRCQTGGEKGREKREKGDTREKKKRRRLNNIDCSGLLLGISYARQQREGGCQTFHGEGSPVATNIPNEEIICVGTWGGEGGEKQKSHLNDQGID